MGATLRALRRPSGAVDGTTGGSESCNLVPWGRRRFPLLRCHIYPFADSEAAVAEFRAEGLIKSTGRIYVQNYVLFLRAAGGKITFLREYFDPVRAAKALDAPILGLES